MDSLFSLSAICLFSACAVASSCQRTLIDDEAEAATDGTTLNQLPEISIAKNDTACFYLSGTEIANITLLNTPTPSTLIENTRYRVPRKLEVLHVLKTITLPANYWQSGQRILCYDESTETYYSYTPQGSVTKAGYKTPYCLLPIRSEHLQSTNEQIEISVNDQWQ